MKSRFTVEFETEEQLLGFARTLLAIEDFKNSKTKPTTSKVVYVHTINDNLAFYWNNCQICFYPKDGLQENKYIDNLFVPTLNQIFDEQRKSKEWRTKNNYYGGLKYGYAVIQLP